MFSRYLEELKGFWKGDFAVATTTTTTTSSSRAWSGPRLSLMAIKRRSDGIEDVVSV